MDLLNIFLISIGTFFLIELSVFMVGYAFRHNLRRWLAGLINEPDYKYQALMEEVKHINEEILKNTDTMTRIAEGHDKLNQDTSNLKKIVTINLMEVVSATENLKKMLNNQNSKNLPTSNTNLNVLTGKTTKKTTRVSHSGKKPSTK